jgi:hypothetical protein
MEVHMQYNLRRKRVNDNPPKKTVETKKGNETKKIVETKKTSENPPKKILERNNVESSTPKLLKLLRQIERGVNQLLLCLNNFKSIKPFLIFHPDQGIKFCSKIQSARNHFKSNESVGLIVANPTQLIWVQTDVGSERYRDLFESSNR